MLSQCPCTSRIRPPPKSRVKDGGVGVLRSAGVCVLRETGVCVPLRVAGNRRLPRFDRAAHAAAGTEEPDVTRRRPVKKASRRINPCSARVPAYSGEW